MKINLLPFEKREKTKIIKQNLGFLIVCLSILVIVGIFVLILIATQFTLKSNLTALEDNAKTAKASLNSYDEIKNEILFIKDRVQEMNNLKSKKTIWSQNLEALAQSTPNTIQLTNFSLTKDGKPDIKIDGYATSRVEIIKFEEQLESSPYFKDVNFASSQKQLENDQEKTNFSLTANLEDNKGTK